jgi:hypothetical protein
MQAARRSPDGPPETIGPRPGIPAPQAGIHKGPLPTSSLHTDAIWGMVCPRLRSPAPTESDELLQVVLDDLGVTHLGLVWIEASGAPCPALA